MNFCPFNSLHYLNGLANIGYAEVDKNGRTVVLRRPIEGTTFFDGIGPWPYLWVNGPRDIDDLCESFRHLVTLTIVTQPGYIPKVSKGDVRFLKQHFVYDPSVPLHSLSKRSLSRLLKSEKIGTFEKVVDMEERMVIADLYKTLIKRRNLSGGFFDMPNSHFKAIAELESAVFFPG